MCHRLVLTVEKARVNTMHLTSFIEAIILMYNMEYSSLLGGAPAMIYRWRKIWGRSLPLNNEDRLPYPCLWLNEWCWPVVRWCDFGALFEDWLHSSSFTTIRENILIVRCLKRLNESCLHFKVCLSLLFVQILSQIVDVEKNWSCM